MHGATLLTRRAFLRLTGLGAGMTIMPMLLEGCAVNPVSGRRQLMMMSPDQEIDVDRRQSPFQFSADYGQVKDTGLNDYLDRVGREIAARSHRPEMPFSFRAVNAAYLNAYAFPGGSIAATRGILVKLDNEAELAALLAHEIAHVNARHTAEHMSKSALIGILVAGASAAAGASGYGDLARDLGGLGAGALLAHYSRENEREADALGMEYMTRTGYTPWGMVGLHEVLLEERQRKPSTLDLMFSTHPMSEERHQTAIQAARTRYAAMLDAPDHRERYLDHTASLRAISGAIAVLQDGETAMGDGNYPQAEEKFAQALIVAPDDYAALVMMAKCQLVQKKIDPAETYASQAVQVYPQEAQAHGVLGLAGLHNEKYEQAYNRFSIYDRLLPGNPTIVFFQGLCLEGMQRIREAAQHYYRYLQEVQEGPRAQYAYRRLREWGYIK
jgi:predicted Zn-dependent protease